MSTFSGKAIGRRLASYRKLNGWTMDELAERTRGQVKKDVIANIESGRRADITVQQLMSLAAALEASPIALMFDLEKPGKPAEVQLDISRRASATDDSIVSRPMLLWEILRWMSAEEVAALGESTPARARVNKVIAATKQFVAAMYEFRRLDAEYTAELAAAEVTKATGKWGESEASDLFLSKETREYALRRYWDTYRAAIEIGIEIDNPPSAPEPAALVEPEWPSFDG